MNGLNKTYMLNFINEDALIKASLILNDKKYSITEFSINFSRGIDFKGQPQNAMRGGIITVQLSEAPDNILYDWAKKSSKQLTGNIIFFNENVGTRLDILFTNAYCIEFVSNVGSIGGASTIISISSEIIEIGEFKLNNDWS